MVQFIKTIKLRWSDLFLVVYGIFGALICVESNYLMMHQNPIDLQMPLWVYIIYFVIYICSFIAYFYLEANREKDNKPILLSTIVLLIAITIVTISLFSNDNTIIIDIEDLDNNIHSIATTITAQTKTVHYFAILFFVLSIFVLITFFSKRIEKIQYVSLLIYFFYVFSFVVFVISLFLDDYIFLFKTMFSGEEFDVRIEELAPMGIFGNKNVYGKFLELGLFVSLINYSLTKKKHNLVIGLLFYIHLLITICEVGILCSSIVIIIYSIIYLVLSIIEKNKREIRIFSVIVMAIAFLTILVIILICTVSSIRNLFDYFITHLSSLLSRSEIWSYSKQITINTSILFGAGYGVFNSILYNTTSTITEEGIWCSHSFLFSLLGREGIFAVCLYLSFVIASIYISVRLFSKNKYFIISVLALEVSFFTHSCFEDYYDMVFVALMFLLVANNINKNNNPLQVDKYNSYK